MRFLLIVVVFFLALNELEAQSGILYPDNFLVFSNSMHLINPAYIPELHKISIGTSYKARTKVSDISTFEAHAEKVFRNKNKGSHLLRIYMFNEREGPYISYPKFFGNYALGLPLNTSTTLFAGLALGFSRINYSAPSGTGSGTAFDASMGLAVRHKNLYAGGGIFQLLNNEAIAISLPLIFARYYHLHFDYKKKITNVVSGKLSGLYRYLPKLKNQVSAGPSILFGNFFETGGIYHLRRGVSFFGTFKFNPEVNPFAISFAYNSTLFTPLGPTYEFYELSLKYAIK